MFARRTLIIHLWLILQAKSSLGLSSEVSTFCDRSLILPCPQMVLSTAVLRLNWGFLFWELK